MELKQFKIAVLPLRSKLLNYARRLTDDPDDAEDAVQETMLRLWNRRAELEQYRSIEAFAMTLVHNLCMDPGESGATNTFRWTMCPTAHPKQLRNSYWR